MALRNINLPQCDLCGELWLPSERNVYRGISAREDPRGYDAERRKDRLVGLRCGKCKSPLWDRKFTGDRRRKDPHTKPEPMSGN